MTKTVHRIVWDDAYIAAAQRMIIDQQNWSLRILYKWWPWWLPRIVIVSIIGSLAVTGVKFDWAFYAYIVGFLILSLFGEYCTHRSLARARARNRNRGSTSTVTLNSEGIDIVGAVAIMVKADGVLLMTSNLLGLWLPDAAITEGTPDDVRKLIAAHRVVAAHPGQFNRDWQDPMVAAGRRRIDGLRPVRSHCSFTADEALRRCL